MDDLTNKLSSVLNDPAGIEKIRALAQNLFSENENTPAGNQADISKFLPIINGLGQAENDERVKLLAALRPHLSPERRKRADKAIGILKAASLLPLLRESGIFEL